MRSEHSTWRPLSRTIKKLWPLKTLHRRSSPPPLPIQQVGQVRNKAHHTSVLLHCLLIASSRLVFTSRLPLLSYFFNLFSYIRLSFLTAHLFTSSTLILPPSLTPTLRWISNNRPWLFMWSDWLQTLFSTSSSPARSTLFIFLPPFFCLTSSFHAITFPWISAASKMAVAECLFVFVYLCVCFLMSSL